MTRTAISPRLAMRIFLSTSDNVGAMDGVNANWLENGAENGVERHGRWLVRAVAETGSTNADLLALVDKENLPDFLGGACTHFGQHKDGVGPWNDYEIVNPVGIRKKQEAPAVTGEDAHHDQINATTAASTKEESKHHE